jgi:FkbM family methyltransferase
MTAFAHPSPGASHLWDILQPARRTRVVDIGANPIDGDPPYKAMLQAGLCEVVGFEPQGTAWAELQRRKGPLETYLPHAVGDGGKHTLHLCRASGMTSLYAPDPATLELFAALKPLGEVLSTETMTTRRLDDIAEIAGLDFLKIDIQGGELEVFRHGREKLARAVAIQTEVSFVTLYRDQPALGEVDVELRAQGFMPHCFAAVKQWPIAPLVVNGDDRQPLNQLLEADLVYVRDFRQPEGLDAEQLKQLALIAHHCYGSFDLAVRCLYLLEQRGELPAGGRDAYLRGLG